MPYKDKKDEHEYNIRRNKNPERIKQNKEIRYRGRNYINSKKLKCCLCGCSDTSKLVFHHKDKNNKNENISHMIGFSIDNINEELNKCVVLCNSCHRKIHHYLLD